MVSRQCLEEPYEGRIFLFPPLDKEFAIAELSAKRLCGHLETPVASIISYFDYNV
jgi:hypothetical protein